ncbi:unnamed protein product [Rotaria magnacalcarata]|uniref:V-SNARE coiled-coil homology domain-containing protein n=1 Tax=Rotaria magnacalcarata TaxID=392030 RepID=A0A819CY67_9BILA|nr:unnamed protein product [Rotaria magnacalcarata]CAF3825479.1 unnamed protein product [Rotaria magnacalcarata]CAF3835158.1 unnamed protein product [Rotaria magnacalcarata]CAF3923477.1 unnamed protein product [Rotaria magnacalcarata]
MSDPVDNKTNNLNALRADVTETTNVLRVTVEKLVDRGDRLDALNARAEDLNSSSYHFHGSARRIQRTMKWRNYKITIFISNCGRTHCNWCNCINRTSSMEKIIE